MGHPRSSIPSTPDPFVPFEAHHASEHERAPDGRGFIRERVRRVSEQDIRGEMGSRWPHRVLYESPTDTPMMEPMPVLRDALLYCCTQQQRVWRTPSHHVRTAEHDVNVAPDTVAVL